MDDKDYMVVCCMCGNKHIIRNVSSMGGNPAKFLHIDQFRQSQAMQMAAQDGWTFYPRVERLDTWEAVCRNCRMLFKELNS